MFFKVIIGFVNPAENILATKAANKISINPIIIIEFLIL